jgi:hypothetical protein
MHSVERALRDVRANPTCLALLFLFVFLVPTTIRLTEELIHHKDEVDAARERVAVCASDKGRLKILGVCEEDEHRLQHSAFYFAVSGIMKLWGLDPESNGLGAWVAGVIALAALVSFCAQTRRRAR